MKKKNQPANDRNFFSRFRSIFPNGKDGKSGFPYAPGSQSKTSKLTQEQRDEIRVKYHLGDDIIKLGEHYLVTTGTIRRVLGHLYVAPRRGKK